MGRRRKGRLRKHREKGREKEFQTITMGMNRVRMTDPSNPKMNL